MTDEPDPAGTDRDRRARLRVVGAEHAPADAPMPGSAGDPGAATHRMNRIGGDEGPAAAGYQSVGNQGVGSRGTGDDSAGAGSLDGEAARDPDDGDESEVQEWPWVAEWRESGEPVPWATGLPLAAFAAVLAGVAIWVLSAGLADRPILAVLLNLLVAGGLVPAMWLSRNLPVLRWFAAGAAVGVVGGWVAALMML